MEGEFSEVGPSTLKTLDEPVASSPIAQLLGELLGVGQVAMDGALRDVEARSYVAVREPPGSQDEYLYLPVRQQPIRLPSRRPFERLLGMLRPDLVSRD